MSEPELAVIELPNGLVVNARTQLGTDFGAMKTLIESGVSFREVAKSFKVSEQLVRRKAKTEGWLTPAAIGKMRRELGRKQELAYRRTGKTMDLSALKAEIWQERGEQLKEKTYEIVQAALEGVTPAQAKTLIRNPLGLAHITTVVRQITGEEAREANEAPRLAVNIGLLRSSRPVVIDADVVDQS